MEDSLNTTFVQDLEETTKLRIDKQRLYVFLIELMDDIQWEHGFGSPLYETVRKFLIAEGVVQEEDPDETSFKEHDDNYNDYDEFDEASIDPNDGLDYGYDDFVDE